MHQRWLVVEVAHQAQEMVRGFLGVVWGMAVLYISGPCACTWMRMMGQGGKNRNLVWVGSVSSGGSVRAPWLVRILVSTDKPSFHVHGVRFVSVDRSKLRGHCIARTLHKFTKVFCLLCLHITWCPLCWRDLQIHRHMHMLYMLVQAISERGCPYVHMRVEEGDGRVLLKFLTDLIYCEIILLSGIIASIGTAPVDFKI